MEFKKYIKKMAKEANIQLTYDNRVLITEFFDFNNWFSLLSLDEDNKIYLTDEQIQLFSEHLLIFLKSINTSKEENYRKLHEMFSNKYETTCSYLDTFFTKISPDEESRFYIMDFLLYELEKDIYLMNDEEVSYLVHKSVNGLIKKHGDILTFFISWLKSKTKTAYKNDYVLHKRSNKATEAYSEEEYLKFLYYFFNQDYIKKNSMYQKAAESKEYADTWLYISLHFICACRDTDLIRIPNPILPEPASNILEQVQNDTFSEASARSTLYSITWRLTAIPLTPNKTMKHSNISSIKFIVPESCEVHIGTLFAICEAHKQLKNSDASLIQTVKTYEDIKKYMGEEISSLFLNANFSARAANKAYLQAIELLTDDILHTQSDFTAKGYILAALARSHKGGFDDFASTTATYLKDSAFNGLTPEYVAMELFERGVLSFIPSMLLKIVTDGEYNTLSASQQTSLIKKLNMTPNEIENFFSIIEVQNQKSEKVVKEIIQAQYDNCTILNALHLIGMGAAFSKQTECMCILTAFGKVCPYDSRSTCIGCDYEISTKSTLFLMVSEYNRIKTLYSTSKNEIEKNKYKSILVQLIIPSFDEILTNIKQQYGEETFKTYEKLIEENIA